MQEKPKVVISRTRRADSAAKDFAFAESDIRAGKDSVASYRASAWSAFKKHSLPDTTQEAWRRTDIHVLPVDKFKFAKDGEFNDLPSVREDLLKPLTGNQHGGQIVIVPGGSKIELDEKLAKKGVIFTDLKTAEESYPDLLAKMMGKTVNVEEGKFSALAGAFAQNGVVLYVPKGVIVGEPLHSVLWGPGADLAHISHILVLVDENASVTYVHESASPDEAGANSLHAGIVEIQVMEGATMKFVELQSWGRHVWNFSHERARVEHGGNLDWIFGAIGSRLTKNFSELDLAGEGAQGRMSGFYFTDGNQHLDHDTQQNHLAPHTTSDLLFKGALKGKSRSVWQGMIYVAPGAQKTDGYQANRNLVLSDAARADSIPGLEILADDVRCTHGATVGKLEQEPLFYLKSRGIPQAEAEKIVVEGFFDPIFQRIPFEGVRERFQQYIADKMAYRESRKLMAKVKSKTKSKAKTAKAKPAARKSVKVAGRSKPRTSTPKGRAKTTPRPKPKSIVLSPPSKPVSARARPVATTKVRVVNKLYSSRVTSSEDRRMLKGLRLPQYNYMKPPGAMHDFQVGDTVEVYCDHEKNRDRIRGWIRGIVVQVDNKLVAVQFRSNVFLTDGWMVPDRILWYPLNSEHMRPVPGKKSAKREEKAIPDY